MDLNLVHALVLLVALGAVQAAFHRLRLLRADLAQLSALVRATSGLAREAEAQSTSLAIQVTDLMAKTEAPAPKPGPPPVRLAEWEEQTVSSILALKDKGMQQRKAYQEQLRLEAIIAKLDRFVPMPFAELKPESKEAIRRMPTIEEVELAARRNA